MAKDYVESKTKKRKSAKGTTWVLILAAVIFVFILVKFAMNNSAGFNTSGLPSNDDAYSIAKGFVKATVRSNTVDFPGPGYQIAKKSDSVYIIRSVVSLTSDDGEEKTANFKLLIQYKGGKQTELKNWALLNIKEEQ